MITISNIRLVDKNDYDEVWAIVRKNKDNDFKQVVELAPSKELFSWYYQHRDEWNKELFIEEYYPRFIEEFTQEGKNKLKELRQLDKENKNICLVCFCFDETMCHRSIIAGILQGMGCNVKTDTGNDYSLYYKDFLKIHGKKKGN